jgi:hypothetical protein
MLIQKQLAKIRKVKLTMKYHLTIPFHVPNHLTILLSGENLAILSVIGIPLDHQISERIRLNLHSSFAQVVGAVTFALTQVTPTWPEVRYWRIAHLMLCTHLDA